MAGQIFVPSGQMTYLATRCAVFTAKIPKEFFEIQIAWEYLKTFLEEAFIEKAENVWLNQKKCENFPKVLD